MASLVANASVDMTDWNFNDIKNGTITTHSSFKYAISGADGHHFYQFTGSGLTYDANFKLTGGTVTGLKVVDDHGDTLYTLSGFNMAATLLKTTIGNGDSTGAFEGAVFGDNDTITGSAHDDVLVGFAGQNVIDGGAGDDIIDATKGTLDRVTGGDGDDTVFASLLIGSIDGGAGYDNVVWNINTTYPLNLSSLFSNVERFTLLGGPNYNFRADDSFIAANASMTIDASALKSNARVYFDGQTEKDGSYEFLGSAGKDRLWGGSANDTFDMTTGGVDRVHGGAGTNAFFFGGALTTADRIDGTTAGGYNQLFLDGDYSAGLVFDSHTIRGVDVIALASGHNYNLTMNEANVAAGATLTLLALQLKGGDSVTFDGSAETDGVFTLSDGYGNDTLIGGQGKDQFISVGGTDVITGNGGDDIISFTSGAFDATDTVNGGAGTDELDLLGDYTDGVVFGANTVRGIEKIVLIDGGDYNLTLNDNTVAAGLSLTVDGSGLSATSELILNGAAETNGQLVLTGGAGDDTLTGGARTDTITGGLGADKITGGGGSDIIVYNATAESTGLNYDTVDGFFFTRDQFDLATAVTGVDAAVTTGALSAATFNADLATALDALHLGESHAVLFTANSGSLAGHTFLVVDQNGIAGYQANLDLVVEMTHIDHANSISTGSFI